MYLIDCKTHVFWIKETGWFDKKKQNDGSIRTRYSTSGAWPQVFATVNCPISASISPDNLPIARHRSPCANVSEERLLVPGNMGLSPSSSEASPGPATLWSVWALPWVVSHKYDLSCSVFHLGHETIRSSSVSAFDSNGTGWSGNPQLCHLIPSPSTTCWPMLTINIDGTDVITDDLQGQWAWNMINWEPDQNLLTIATVDFWIWIW